MSTTMIKTDCGCEKHGGAEICTDMNFKRPRFFAGQLLTEDDLQALTDYVVGKNRLHNRFFFGEGVVCGLNVTCHPCGEGQVIVAPGFALDCCGNDILLPCKEELDIKAMLSDLQRQQLAGYECGDPCDEKEGNKRTYGLYLSYRETLEDPVAPYTSGDHCGQQTCEPTRICEGYQFELRCDCNQPERTDLFKRLAACIGDLKQATTAISKAQTADFQANQLQSASYAIHADAAIPFDEKSVKILSEVTPELSKLNTISLDKDLDDNGLPKLKPDEKALRLDVARVQLLTGAITRFRAMPTKEREAVLKANKGLDKLLKEASANVAEAGLRIQALSPKVIKTPIARTEAEESVRLSQKYALDEISESQFDTMEARMVALNTPLSYRQVNRMRHDAAFLKEWLLDKLSSASNLTRCDLYDRLRRVQIEALTGKDVNGELAEFSASARAVKQLVQIFVEYLIDCICLALTPPCQPCDDHGVLLACVTVKDCEVIDICNMSRRFVLTPVAMRYWLPPIGMIGDLLKRLCCDLDMDKLLGSKERVPEDRHPQKTVEMFLMTRPEEMSIAKTYAPVMSEAALDDDTAQVLKRFRIEPRDVETVTAFSSNLALLSARAVDIQPAAIANRGAAIAAAISDRFNTTAPATLVESTPYDRVAEVIEKEVSAARKRVVSELESNLDRSVDESLKKARTELAETVKKDLGGTLDKRVTQDVKTAVARELTEAKLRRAIQGTDTVKTLKEESRKLTRELKKLSDAVEALKTGGSS